MVRSGCQTVEQMQERADPVASGGFVQGNIDQGAEMGPCLSAGDAGRYHELSLTAADSLPMPELLVWPETGAPFFYGFDPGLTGNSRNHTECGVPLLFGSPCRDVPKAAPVNRRTLSM